MSARSETRGTVTSVGRDSFEALMCGDGAGWATEIPVAALAESDRRILGPGATLSWISSEAGTRLALGDALPPPPRPAGRWREFMA